MCRAYDVGLDEVSGQWVCGLRHVRRWCREFTGRLLRERMSSWCRRMFVAHEDDACSFCNCLSPPYNNLM